MKLLGAGGARLSALLVGFRRWGGFSQREDRRATGCTRGEVGRTPAGGVSLCQRAAAAPGKRRGSTCRERRAGERLGSPGERCSPGRLPPGVFPQR